MLVCHCNAVSERKIRKVIRSGCMSLGAIASRCGAGGGCGGCRSEVAQILNEELQEAQQTSPVVPDLSDGALVSP